MIFYFLKFICLWITIFKKCTYSIKINNLQYYQQKMYTNKLVKKAYHKFLFFIFNFSILDLSPPSRFFIIVTLDTRSSCFFFNSFTLKS